MTHQQTLQYSSAESESWIVCVPYAQLSILSQEDLAERGSLQNKTVGLWIVQHCGELDMFAKTCHDLSLIRDTDEPIMSVKNKSKGGGE
jgi:hypothetical protein